MARWALASSLAVILALWPQPAAAQADFVKENVSRLIRKVGFHVSTNFADPVDSTRAYRDGSYGISVGLAPGTANGWRYPFGIAWYTEELVSANGTIFAELKARPIYGGIGYGWHFGKLSTGAQVQAGWSFNSLKPHGDPQLAFDAAPASVIMDVGNAFAVRPQLKVEYFVTRKVTVRSSELCVHESTRHGDHTERHDLRALERQQRVAVAWCGTVSVQEITPTTGLRVAGGITRSERGERSVLLAKLFFFGRAQARGRP
jgi:hypothetical protein